MRSCPQRHLLPVFQQLPHLFSFAHNLSGKPFQLFRSLKTLLSILLPLSGAMTSCRYSHSYSYTPARITLLAQCARATNNRIVLAVVIQLCAFSLDPKASLWGTNKRALFGAGQANRDFCTRHLTYLNSKPFLQKLAGNLAFVSPIFEFLGERFKSDLPKDYTLSALDAIRERDCKAMKAVSEVLTLIVSNAFLLWRPSSRRSVSVRGREVELPSATV